jgi:NAD(P)H-flavin reductase
VVGGFTITSPPQASHPGQNDPHIELAIQSSPENPPAAYLWRPVSEILDSEVSFKVGGNFVYPPSTLNREQCERIDRAVFVAGGVGINPIISMISAMNEVGTRATLGGMPRTVRVLYTARSERDKGGEGEEILFERRLNDIAKKWRDDQQVDYQYTFFETSGQSAQEETKPGNITTRRRRINHEDLLEAIGPEHARGNTVAYICGLPTMTDEFVDLLRNTPGLDDKRVLCEKWW